MKEKFKSAASYSYLTPLYDIGCELLGYGKSFKDKIVEKLEITPNQKILDIGCGTGTFLIELKRKYPKTNVFGIDPDQKILKIAQNKLDKVGFEAKLIKGLAQELPFSKNYFDNVVSILTFHHLPTEVKRQAISEIYRVLKNGGTFLLADFGKPESLISNVLLKIGSTFEGRENMEANLSGKLPQMLKDYRFKVDVIGERFRGIQFLNTTKL